MARVPELISLVQAIGNSFMSIAFILKHRYSKRKPDQDFAQTLHREVDQLLDLFNSAPFQVFMVGGVGLALHRGDFHRDHRDYDIAVLKEDLGTLARHLDSRGYFLGRRRFMMHIFAGLNLELFARLEPGFEFTGHKTKYTIRMVKKGLFHVYPGRLTVIDVFPFIRQGKHIRFIGKYPLEPAKYFFPGKKIREQSSLLLPNLTHYNYVPVKNIRQAEDYRRAGITPFTFPGEEDQAWLSLGNSGSSSPS